MKKKIIAAVMLGLLTVSMVGCGFLPYSEDLKTVKQEETEDDMEFTSKPVGGADSEEGEEAEEVPRETEAPRETPEETEEPVEKTVMDEAEYKAAQYDYDGAIELLQSQPDYDSNTEMQTAVSNYEETKATCAAWPIDQVTHVFYHTLIYDTAKAFDGDSDSAGYNQVMTTVDEFNKITQSMYDRGFVMVRMEDMAKKDENGNMVAQEILLPPGKQPFVLSQDDVSYYHYMDGDGMASRLVLDSNGEVKNEYIEDDGSVSVGDYDMVPLIDSFVKEHPDFSYKGAKGIIALTGYNGILGYRTDISYQEQPADLNEDKKAWLAAHPDFSLEEERVQATAVAAAMKENGWEFASHTWGHLNVGEIPLENLQADTQRWQDNVAPLIGGSNKIIFAFGADIGGVEEYAGDKFEFLKSQGFDYYCNVDSSQYWVQLTSRYLRQGRRNLDGYRMYYNPELLTDLFDPASVFDPARPTPVAPM